jgi:hypothetical protein
MEAVDRAVTALWESHFSIVQHKQQLEFVMTMPVVKNLMEEFTVDQVMNAIQRKRSGGAGDERPVKEAEFDALSEAKSEIGADVPEGDFHARTLPIEAWTSKWTAPLERVVLVHRLREVVAQVGFTRFEAAGPDIQGELDMEVQRAPLGLDVSWLPAIENRGEGIFLQFQPQVIDAWLGKKTVTDRDAQLQTGLRRA